MKSDDGEMRKYSVISLLSRPENWVTLCFSDKTHDPGVDGRIILRLIFRKWDVGGYGLDGAG
jgi:hypothetical protein